MTKGISHITFIVKDLNKAAYFFTEIFAAKEVYSSGDKTFSLSKAKYFLIKNIWIAIMEGVPTQRSYNHIAFNVSEKDLVIFEKRIKKLGLEIKPARSRKPEEGKSLYFYDYDNHLFELHSGTLKKRLKLYKKSN